MDNVKNKFDKDNFVEKDFLDLNKNNYNSLIHIRDEDGNKLSHAIKSVMIIIQELK